MQLRTWYNNTFFVLMCSAIPAHAGFFDFLTGSDNKPQTAETDKTAAPSAAPAIPAPAGSAGVDCASAPAKTGKKTSGKKSLQAELIDCLKTPLTNADSPEFFSAKKVSAQDLIKEMRSIRSSFGSNDPVKAMSNLLIPVPIGASAAKNAPVTPAGIFAGLFGQAATGAPGGASGITGSLNSLVGNTMLDMLISGISYRAIDSFFGEILDDKDVLSKVFVEVPNTASLTPELRKQVLNLSAFLAVIKASGMVIDSSQKEFEKAKESYGKVLEMRGKATRLLGDALQAKEGLEASRRDAKARNQQLLSAAELEYLTQFQDKKPEELLQDFAAQNIALNYLRAKDPQAYRNYDLEVREVKSHYGAYVRTATGASAMVGFSAMFIKRSKKLIEQQGMAGGTLLTPLMLQGISELASLAPRVKSSLKSGDDITEGSFKLMRGTETLKRGIPAKNVFGVLDEAALTQFKGDLLNINGNGYLLGLYKSNPASAGKLADRVVSKSSKDAYAQDYLQMENTNDFSFQNALEGKMSATAKKKNIAQELFSPADAASTDQSDTVLLKVQNELVNNLSDYSNSDVRNFMFLHSKEHATSPKLQVAQYTIEVDSLGMDGLVDYDNYLTAGLAHARIRQFDKKESRPKAGSKKNAPV